MDTFARIPVGRRRWCPTSTSAPTRVAPDLASVETRRRDRPLRDDAVSSDVPTPPGRPAPLGQPAQPGQPTRLGPPPRLGRLGRLAEEIVDELPPVARTVATDEEVLTELAHALRPPRHERRIPTYGAFVSPTSDPDRWGELTGLTIELDTTELDELASSRRYADGLASWLVIGPDRPPRLVAFDRPVSSERDLVIVAAASGATVVQRHPSGLVRIAGGFGVVRTDGLTWHLEPPVDTWLDQTCRRRAGLVDGTLEAAIAFAVHDLGAQGIGATLVLHPAVAGLVDAGSRLGSAAADPPPLCITRAADLAPLRQALAHLDGASMFDGSGTLRALGAHLVPSRRAESAIDVQGGTRHTSARRFSHDHPEALVVVVSEDGPVTVFEHGEVRASSSTGSSADHRTIPEREEP